ncbi:hypothetical protein F4778DRAFT_802913 [Xylariomycetidae sp. FL2044]|nr:hypothetical protein F4778DRAFT_802913 [Xylariomycetidae sp. FL2044]
MKFLKPFYLLAAVGGSLASGEGLAPRSPESDVQAREPASPSHHADLVSRTTGNTIPSGVIISGEDLNVGLAYFTAHDIQTAMNVGNSLVYGDRQATWNGLAYPDPYDESMGAIANNDRGAAGGGQMLWTYPLRSTLIEPDGYQGVFLPNRDGNPLFVGTFSINHADPTRAILGHEAVPQNDHNLMLQTTPGVPGNNPSLRYRYHVGYGILAAIMYWYGRCDIELGDAMFSKRNFDVDSESVPLEEREGYWPLPRRLREPRASDSNQCHMNG